MAELVVADTVLAVFKFRKTNKTVASVASRVIEYRMMLRY